MEQQIVAPITTVIEMFAKVLVEQTAKNKTIL